MGDRSLSFGQVVTPFRDACPSEREHDLLSTHSLHRLPDSPLDVLALLLGEQVP
jgi:hypothetical protein